MSKGQVKCPDGVYRHAENPDPREIRRTDVEEEFKDSDFMKDVGKWKKVEK